MLNKRALLIGASIVLFLGVLLVAFFWPVVGGGRTLLPLDNLFEFPPWNAYATQFDVQVPHNELLSDLILENYVWKRFIVQSLQSGELPLWNPHILGGQPFLAAGQHSAMYPLSVLFYVLPLVRAYGIFTVAQLLLAGLFMFVYARTIGLERVASVVSAVVFTFSGFMIVSVVHPMIIAAASWLPLMLAVVERLIRTQEGDTPERERRPVSYIPWIAVGAVALGLHLLAGHVEIAYYVVLVTAFYAACRLAIYWMRVRNRAQLAKLALAVGLLFVLGVALAAIQVIPLYELVTLNFRQESASYQQIVGWAYPIRRLVAFVMPDFFGNPAHHSYFDVFTRTPVTVLQNAQGQSIDTIYWSQKNYVEGGSYVGLLPLILALVAVWKARSRYVWIFLSLALVSLAFVFGTPLYAVLYYLLPGIKQLHSPFRWVFPYTFSVAVMAGCGVSWLMGELSEANRRFVRGIGVLAVAAAVLGLAALAVSLGFPGQVSSLAQQVMLALAKAPEAFADGRAFYSYQFRNLLILFLALGGSGLAMMARAARTRIAGVQLWMMLTLVVIIAELFVIGVPFNPAADPKILDFRPEVVSFLQADEGLWRFTTLDAAGEKTFNANAGMFYDLDDVRGYDSIIVRPYAQFMELLEPQGELLYNRIAPLRDPRSLDSPLLDLLNVKYVVTTQAIENADYTLVHSGEVRVYRNDDYLPRAFVVHRAQVVPDPQARAEALRQLDPRQTVVLEETPALTVPAGAGWEPATVLAYGPNEVLLEVVLDQGGYLVLADTHFPGWKAYDTRPGQSEQEIPLYRANGTFRAVVLGPGQHIVRFKYTPFSLKLGLFVSFMAGAILVLLLGLWLWRRFYSEDDADSSVKRVAKNALTPMVLSLVNRIIDMAFAMLTLRVLTPGGAGRYQFAINFIGYFETFVLFGLGTWITREMSKHRQSANRYWSNSIVLRFALWLSSLPVMALAVLAYARLSGLASDTVMAIVFYAAALIPEFVSDSFSATFLANERMEYPAAISSVTTVLRVTLGTAALLLGYGFVGLAATSLVVNLITMLMLGLLASRMFFRPKLGFEPTFGREMARESLPLMLNNLLSKVFFMSDVLLLQPLRGDVEVGYYGAAYRYIRGLDIIPSYFTMAIFPLISRFAESKRDSLVRAYALSIKLLLMVALPIAVGTTFIARELILILAGPDYLPQSAIALQLLVWYMPVGFINSVTQYVLIAIDQQRFLTRAFVIGAAFNITSNLVLIPRYGYAAAAAVTALSEVALFIPFQYSVRKHLTRLSWFDLFWRPSAAALIMAAVLWVLRGWSVLVTVPVAAVVYLAALTAVGTFRQPDVALVMGLLPLPLRQRLRLVIGDLDQAVPRG